MLYQVTFSPTQSEDLKCHEFEHKLEDIPVLTLAPFTCNPKIYFDGVKKDTCVSRKLQIINPTKQNFEVTLIKYPTDDRRLSYSWIQNVIHAECSLQLEISWEPIETGGFCESITLQYGHHLKKSVSVICKCVAPRNRQKKTYNSPGKLKRLKKKTIRRTPTSKIRTRPDIAKRKNPELTSQTNDIAVSTPAITSNIPIITKNDENDIKLQDIHVTPIIKVRLHSPNAKRRNLNVPLKSRFSIKTSPRKVEFDEKTFVVKKKQRVSVNVSPKKFDERTFVVKKQLELKTQTVNNEFNYSQSKVKFKDEAFVVKEKSLLGKVIKNTHQTSLNKFNEKTFIVKKKSPLKKTKFDEGQPTCNKSNLNKLEAKRFDNTFIIKTREKRRRNSSIDKKRMLKNNKDSIIKNKMKTLDQNLASVQKRKRDITNENNTNTPIKLSSDLDTSPTKKNISTDKITFERNLEESRTLEEFFKNSFDNLKLSSDFNDDNQITIDVSLPTSNNLTIVQDLENITLEISSNNNKQLEGRDDKCKENEIKLHEFSDIDQKTEVDNKYQTSNDNRKEIQKKRRSDLPHKIFGKKMKPQIHDLHNPDEYLANLNLEKIKCNWTNAEESCIKKEVNLLLVPSPECSSNSKPDTIDKLLQKCTKPPKTDTSTALSTIRSEATYLFRSPEVFKVISKIIHAVESGKLSIGSDKNVHNSTPLQQQIITLLLNYSPTWLRIGLETIFEEIISPKTKSDVTTICDFAMRKLFKNSHLQQKYKSSSSPKYVVEIKKHILRKLLMLIYFLDYSKRSKIISHDPCLFRKSAGLKDSKDILHVFSSKFLTPVRDIFKFLETIGCTLLHKQTYIHEFNFTVENIEEDFKDGVRLVKLLDVVLSKGSMEKLRVPAISRLQKVYNVKVAFDMLMKAGCSVSNISQKDIVAGNRVKTLSLLMLILQLRAVDNAGATL